MKTIKKQKDDCNCGKPLKVNDPRKKVVIKKTIKKRLLK